LVGPDEEKKPAASLPRRNTPVQEKMGQSRLGFSVQPCTSHFDIVNNAIHRVATSLLGAV
jgi:hypothetical protein